MPRDIPVGNGNILIAFDRDGNLREFYFSHVGEGNHTKGEPFRFGVWADGLFSWIGQGWQIKKDYLDDSLVTNVELIHDEFKIRIVFNDLVDFQENIYLKKLSVENLASEEKEIRLFLSHDFHILGNDIGDTALYRPEVKGLLHYKGERYFLINIFANKKYGIDLFAAGNKERANEQGTWKDAEDGLLSGNPVAQGSIDSVIGIPLRLAPSVIIPGVLSQPRTNEPLSVSPLTWSHAAYIAVVQEYLDKILEIEKCADCGLSKYSKYAGKIVR